MVFAKYAKVRGKYGLYGGVELDSVFTDKDASYVTNKCTWNFLKEMYNGYEPVGIPEWIEAVMMGAEYALTKIEQDRCREFIVIDLNGHIAHSNLYSLFAAGFLAVFAELNIQLRKEDMEALYAFVGASTYMAREAIPDATKLAVGMYSL